MKYRSWYHITFRIQESYQDILIGQFTVLGFSGFVQEERTFGCFIPKQKWNQTVQTKFNAILKHFHSQFPAVKLKYDIATIHEKNWNKTWEKQTGIVAVTPHIIIKPSWKKLPRRYKDKLVLHIDPKMSFGTGHHETTRLSLRLIERHLQPKMKMIDFGCGTGILGIAAVKLGAQSVVAIDSDPWSIENTRENIQRNHVQHHMIVRLGSVSALPRLKYDFVVANIDFHTISRFIKSITDRTRTGGIIVLSGILLTDIPHLLPLFKKNSLIPIEFVNENEWTAIALFRV